MKTVQNVLASKMPSVNHNVSSKLKESGAQKYRHLFESLSGIGANFNSKLKNITALFQNQQMVSRSDFNEMSFTISKDFQLLVF